MVYLSNLFESLLIGVGLSAGIVSLILLAVWIYYKKIKQRKPLKATEVVRGVEQAPSFDTSKTPFGAFRRLVSFSSGLLGDDQSSFSSSASSGYSPFDDDTTSINSSFSEANAHRAELIRRLQLAPSNDEVFPRIEAAIDGSALARVRRRSTMPTNYVEMKELDE